MVFVVLYPRIGPQKYQVSSGYGGVPQWSRDGREIFFTGPDRTLMAAQVSTEEGFSVRAIQTLVCDP